MNSELPTPPEQEEWDAFVKAHPKGWICALSAWQRAIEGAFRHIRGSVLTIRDPDSSAIRAGMPVYAVRSWLLGNRLVSVPFATLSDPLADSPEQMTRLFDDAIRYAGQVHASKVEVRTWRCSHIPTEHSLARVVSHQHQFVRLDRTEGDIWKSLHETAIRQRISKAMRNGLSLSEGGTDADLATLIRLVGESRRKLGLPAIPNRFFRSLCDVFRGAGHVRILMVGKGGQTFAAGLFLDYGDTTIVEYVGEVSALRAQGASQLLYWEAMRDAQKCGRRVFSMGRTSMSNQGLMAYKRRWGAVSEDLPQFIYPVAAAPSASRQESRTYGVIRSVLRHSPGPLYRLLGGFLYSHWG